MSGTGLSGPAEERGQAIQLGQPSFETVLRTALFLEAYWRQRSDTSFDPYDGLETERLAFLTKLPRVAQLAVVQFNKRSPVNFRTLEGISPTRNAYAVAHFASAGAIFSRVDRGGRAIDAMVDRLDWLCSHRVEAAWAYPFDVQTKTFAYRKTTPNVICTAFSVEALLDGVSAVAGKVEFAERAAQWKSVAADAVAWTLEHLYLARDGRQYFCYLPTEQSLIHNANVLAARFVARTARMLGNEYWLEIARSCLEVTVRAIGSDGLLPYGEGSGEAWVDGHHTGFVSEALLDLSKWLDDPELRTLADQVRSGYRRSLFEVDGRPLLYPGRRFPIDVIAGAQGIQTFAMAGDDDDIVFGQAIASFMLAEMRTRSGTFVYRKGRTHRKAVPYARWSDAPMCLALARLASALSGEEAPAAGHASEHKEARP
jgi:polysaccharide biosynthesis protein VpsJ